MSLKYDLIKDKITIRMVPRDKGEALCCAFPDLHIYDAIHIPIGGMCAVFCLGTKNNSIITDQTLDALNITEYKLLDGLTADPFGRRHIMCMWQEDDFSDETGGTTKGLNPCCYETIWNVRRGIDGKLYLDMLMNQRSSDFIVSASINEMQYVALQLMVAKHCGYEPGVFTHVSENVQIYERHLSQAKEIVFNRNTIDCDPRFVLDTEKTNFFDFTIDDFKLIGYPREEIAKKNPQMKFDLGI